MQKSIIERVFPKPKQPLLPRYDEPSHTIYHDEEPSSSRIQLSSNVSRASTPASSRRSSGNKSLTKSQLQPAPISASIIHHDDPFIAVDRAAANLQRTIQSLLDFQSEALSGRHQDDPVDTFSQRNAMPTQSMTSNSTLAPNNSNSGTTPVRQPKPKKMTLRGARRGIAKSMQDFAALKAQELKIIDNESVHRRTAIDRAVELEVKKEAVDHEIYSLQHRTGGTGSNALRTEATAVEQEIHELEGRLMELKARHRHLVDRATQLDNAAASELSSYQSTLALIDKGTRSFLRQPPVKQSLAPRNSAADQQGENMYDLRPERRTLNLAKEQWGAELEVLSQHKHDVEGDKDALLQGVDVWRESMEKIGGFEEALRSQMKVGNSESPSNIVDSLDSTMNFLEERLSQAETHDWKLLVCAIGAELEAFRQARAILLPDEQPLLHLRDPPNNTETTNDQHQCVDEEDSDVPHADLLGGHSPQLAFPESTGRSKLIDHSDPDNNGSNSNESLEATLRDFPGKTPSAAASTSASKQLPARRGTRYSESEDDDPGPEFLISN